MRFRSPKRPLASIGNGSFLVHCCETVDHSIPTLRTLLLGLGLVGTALRSGEAADFLFVTGMLLQCAIWFENWWTMSSYKPK